ncbi:MAG: hypothetical protein HOK52_07395 [Candidatus Marinimicrobia bacterium]|nr:hypothetical protein [Candidatus Neomarinimicrobiota bacterium]
MCDHTFTPNGYYAIRCNDEVVEWLIVTYPLSPILGYDWNGCDTVEGMQYTVSEKVYVAMVLKFS